SIAFDATTMFRARSEGLAMNFFEAVVSGFRNYINFSGRASRSEFWFFILFCNLVLILCGGIADSLLSHYSLEELDRIKLDLVLTSIFFALLVPAIAISVRRLHDVDRTGWWLLIKITIIGIIWVLFWYCNKGTTGRNRFGADPLARA
ncbi:MAG TPA: DUF805 domain-containing protein, partial [Pseudolabrys sp.]|nr:DUF805 domain-containing protein [Pseudolabrys sp.]